MLPVIIPLPASPMAPTVWRLCGIQVCVEDSCPDDWVELSDYLGCCCETRQLLSGGKIYFGFLRPGEYHLTICRKKWTLSSNTVCRRKCRQVCRQTCLQNRRINWLVSGKKTCRKDRRCLCHPLCLIVRLSPGGNVEICCNLSQHQYQWRYDRCRYFFNSADSRVQLR